MNYRIKRIDIGGRDVTKYLKLLLRKEGHIFHRSSEFEIVREIKEQICKVRINAAKEEPSEMPKVILNIFKSLSKLFKLNFFFNLQLRSLQPDFEFVRFKAYKILQYKYIALIFYLNY